MTGLSGLCWIDSRIKALPPHIKPKPIYLRIQLLYKSVKFDDFTNQYGSGMLQLSEVKLFDDSVQTWNTIKPTVTGSGENAPTDI